jgi:hypothetical protein
MHLALTCAIRARRELYVFRLGFNHICDNFVSFCLKFPPYFRYLNRFEFKVFISYFRYHKPDRNNRNSSQELYKTQTNTVFIKIAK